MIDAGHHATEKVVVAAMAAYLTAKAAAAGELLVVVASRVNTDPFCLLETDFRGQKPGVDGCPPGYPMGEAPQKQDSEASLLAAGAGPAKSGARQAGRENKGVDSCRCREC